MKTGNGQNPNPRNVFGGSYKADSSNMVNAKAPVKFSAKQGAAGTKKSGGKGTGKKKGM